MKDKYSLYVIKCNINDKLYFGITKRSVEKRISQHLYHAKNGCNFLLHRAIRSHGWDNFTVETVLNNLTAEEACKEEIDHIKRSRSCYERGYNMLIGGQTGISSRPETKERRSEAAKKAWLTSEKMKASVHCEKRREKIGLNTKKCFQRTEYINKFKSRHSEMVEKSKDPECRKRAVSNFIKNGNSTKILCVETGDVFQTTSEASRWVCRVLGEEETYKKNSNILACARGRKKSAYGYKWECIE